MPVMLTQEKWIQSLMQLAKAPPFAAANASLQQAQRPDTALEQELRATLSVHGDLAKKVALEPLVRVAGFLAALSFIIPEILSQEFASCPAKRLSLQTRNFIWGTVFAKLPWSFFLNIATLLSTHFNVNLMSDIRLEEVGFRRLLEEHPNDLPSIIAVIKNMNGALQQAVDTNHRAAFLNLAGVFLISILIPALAFALERPVPRCTTMLVPQSAALLGTAPLSFSLWDRSISSGIRRGNVLGMLPEWSEEARPYIHPAQR